MGDPRAAAVQGQLSLRDLEVTGNRLAEDPLASYQLRFEDGIAAWSLPVGNWDFEVFGTEGALRIANNGIDMEIRKAARLNDRYPVFRPRPVTASRGSMTLACLEDLVDSGEQGRPPLGNVEVSHHATEICFAVAESHRRNGAWVELPMADRDLYIEHV
jgi:predicted dehydrogenase